MREPTQANAYIVVMAILEAVIVGAIIYFKIAFNTFHIFFVILLLVLSLGIWRLNVEKKAYIEAAEKQRKIAAAQQEAEMKKWKEEAEKAEQERKLYRDRYDSGQKEILDWLQSIGWEHRNKVYNLFTDREKTIKQWDRIADDYESERRRTVYGPSMTYRGEVQGSIGDGVARTLNAINTNNYISASNEHQRRIDSLRQQANAYYEKITTLGREIESYCNDMNEHKENMMTVHISSIAHDQERACLFSHKYLRYLN